jgi:hypothetical protein
MQEAQREPYADENGFEQMLQDGPEYFSMLSQQPEHMGA